MLILLLLQSGYVSAMPDVHLGKGVTVSLCPQPGAIMGAAESSASGFWRILRCTSVGKLVHALLDNVMHFMQIGTVFASENYICPNAVGVDIGTSVTILSVTCLHAACRSCYSIRVQFTRNRSALQPISFKLL